MSKNRKIVLFEPEVERFAALQIAMEQYPEVSVYPYALAETAKTLRLYKETYNHSATLDGKLSQSLSIQPEESFEVKAVAMDEFLCEEIDSIDIVKMDIEGAEIYALQGMKLILAESRMHMFLEFHGQYVESCCPGGTDQIRTAFDKHDYSIFTCEGLECTPSGLKDRIYLRPKAV
jgi:FkbM family methyltransferase